MSDVPGRHRVVDCSGPGEPVDIDPALVALASQYTADACRLFHEGKPAEAAQALAMVDALGIPGAPEELRGR